MKTLRQINSNNYAKLKKAIINEDPKRNKKLQCRLFSHFSKTDNGNEKIKPQVKGVQSTKTWNPDAEKLHKFQENETPILRREMKLQILNEKKKNLRAQNRRKKEKGHRQRWSVPGKEDLKRTWVTWKLGLLLPFSAQSKQKEVEVVKTERGLSYGLAEEISDLANEISVTRKFEESQAQLVLLVWSTHSLGLATWVPLTWHYKKKNIIYILLTKI